MNNAELNLSFDEIYQRLQKCKEWGKAEISREDLTLENPIMEVFKKASPSLTQAEIDEADFSAALNQIESRVKLSKMARSEFLVGKEELKELENKVSQVREVLFQRGETYLTHPDYQVEVEDGHLTSDQAKGIYWAHNEGPFKEVSAWLMPDADSFIQTKLWFVVCKEDKTIEVDIGFDNTVKLIIDYYQKDQYLQNQYTTGKTYLDHLTNEESGIISYYCDAYLEHTKEN